MTSEDGGNPKSIRTGDSVLHGPTGEKWLVAYVDADRDRIAWCGWPEGEAALSDCTLVRQCTDDEHLKLLHDLAESQSSTRSSRAKAILAARSRPTGAEEGNEELPHIIETSAGVARS